MKKLSLKKLGLKTDDLLQREQLKTVFGGGYGSGGCSDQCENDNQCYPNQNGIRKCFIVWFALCDDYVGYCGY